MKNLKILLYTIVVYFGFFQVVIAQEKIYEQNLSAGDVIRVQVFQNPDLTLETRIQESGNITYPLIGSAKLAGLSIPEAEKVISTALKAGGFMQQPQVSITQTQARRKQLSVLGSVGKPGQYPLEYVNTHLSDVIAMAGGIAAGGADTVIVTGQREGKPLRQEINIAELYLDGKTANDILMAPSDVAYVHRAPVFYVYGEAQRPGSFRLERNMTFMQALVTAGGPTARGTERRLKLTRQSGGVMKDLSPELNELVQPDDVIYVRESLF
jgi:polysaccharide export outer membrane protein